MNEWNIQSRAHACQVCHRAYADGQAYHTLLTEEKRELVRRDICQACWEAEGGEAAHPAGSCISVWQGVYEAPPAAPPDVIQRENAESLLRKVMERNDPTYGAASYILAVMLERKRLLKVKEQWQREGRRYFVYEQPKTGDLFTILDPDLQLNQLEDVQRQVADLLEHGLPSENPAEGADAPEPNAEVSEGSEADLDPSDDIRPAEEPS